MPKFTTHTVRRPERHEWILAMPAALAEVYEMLEAAERAWRDHPGRTGEVIVELRVTTDSVPSLVAFFLASAPEFGTVAAVRNAAFIADVRRVIHNNGLSPHDRVHQVRELFRTRAGEND